MGTDMEYRGHTVHKDTDLAEDKVVHNEDNVAGRNMGNSILLFHSLHGNTLKHLRNPTVITCP